MARYKPVDPHLSKLLPVKFSEQIIPGTFEYAVNWLVDNEIDLSVFDPRYHNDIVGASAYPPSVLLKVVLLGYARGLVSSRSIERACRENVVFMALSGDSAPHFTTLAAFVSKLSIEIKSVFRDVLLVCDEQGLIGRELFAVDGRAGSEIDPANRFPRERPATEGRAGLGRSRECAGQGKLPSNASRTWSGTQAELVKKADSVAIFRET